MQPCPTRETLEQLLAERLDTAARADLELHVNACHACQATLDELTAVPSPTVPIPKAASVPRDAALHSLLDRMRESPPDTQPTARPQPVKKARTDEVRFPLPPTEAAPLGRLDCYEILEELGWGGSGLLFRARDTKLNRIVAVKVLRQELAALASERARLEREARAAASLRSDHIVTVFDVCMPADFPPYLVMEYIEGGSLAQRLRAGALMTPQEAAGLAEQVARGLDAAHSRGLIHRDIKPSNVLLDAVTGRAKIVDFGLVRAEADDDGLTREGYISGTPAYMSPEQISDPKRIDGRSDLYGLGVVLYEMLTAELPFRGVTRMLLHQVLCDDPRPPRQLNDKVPADLETICLKAMAKDRESRFASAAEMAEDLRRWRAGEPISARPMSGTERLWLWVKRNRDIAGLASAVLLLLTAIAVVAVGAAIQIERSRGVTERARGRAVESLVAEQRARGDAERAHRDAVDAWDQEKRAHGNAEAARREAESARSKMSKALEAETRARADAERARADAERARADAVAAQRETAQSLEREKVARLDAEKARQDAESAKQAAEAAQQLTTKALVRETTALAAAQQARREAELARQQAEEHAREAADQRELAVRSLDRLGAAALDVLLADPQRLTKEAKLDEAIERYHDALQLLREQRLGGVAPRALYERLILPAIQVAARRLEMPDAPADLRRRVAGWYAAAGHLLLDHAAAFAAEGPAAAVQAFEQACQLDPASGGFRLGRADARLRLPELLARDSGGFVQLDDDLRQAERMGVTVPAEIWARVAEARHRRGEFAEADRASERAIAGARASESPALANFVRDWVWTAIAAQRYDEARTRAAQLEPLNPADSALAIGATFERESNWMRAQECYDRGLPSDWNKCEPVHALLLASSAQVRVRISNDARTDASLASRRRQEAVDQLRRAVVLSPRHTLSWYWRGLLARQLKILHDGSIDAAIRDRLRREAIDQLDWAILLAPIGERPQLQDLKRDLAQL